MYVLLPWLRVQIVTDEDGSNRRKLVFTLNKLPVPGVSWFSSRPMHRFKLGIFIYVLLKSFQLDPVKGHFIMLTAKENEGLKAILEKLDNHALVSLLGTITKGMIKPETRNEAVSVILMYLENAFSLLNRRKIKKEILFHYLKDNNVVPSTAADKPACVAECLKLWNSDVDYDDVCEMEDMEDVEEEESYPPSKAPSNNDHLNITSPAFRQQATTETALQKQVLLETPPMTSNLERMGQEFVAWFYQLFNNVNTEPAEFHSNHFWSDCTMQLQISGTNMQLQQLGMRDGLQIHDGPFNEQVLGAENVTNTLKFIAMGKLVFHPNSLQNGISTAMERNGLVRILVNGVLHQGSCCVGLFEQSFALVRSANSEDSWKIKNIELLMQLKHTYLTNS